MSKALVTVSEAAKMMGVCVKTIRDWTNDGRLPHVRTLGGHRRIRTSDIEAMLGGYNDAKGMDRCRDECGSLIVSEPDDLRR